MSDEAYSVTRRMSDADELRAVLGVLRDAGLSVSSLRVGSIALVVGSARSQMVTSEPPPPGQLVEVRSMAEMSDHEALPELRRRSREQFGYVKSDAELLALKGAL